MTADMNMEVMNAVRAVENIIKRIRQTERVKRYPVEIIAHTLRMISAGTKVCVEIGAMAMDAGVLEYGKPVVCIGGTGRNADTACVVTPSYTASILETKVNEFLCKPDFYSHDEQ